MLAHAGLSMAGRIPMAEQAAWGDMQWCICMQGSMQGQWCLDSGTRARAIGIQHALHAAMPTGVSPT